MPIEGRVRQRGLVDRRIVFADSERAASHVFPFVDRRWRVPFVVVNFPEGRPMVLDAPFRPDRFRFRTALRVHDLRRIESVPLQDFDELVHFDPWWVFRRVSGVDRAWVEAVFATNIAAPFRHGGRRYKVRDLAWKRSPRSVRCSGPLRFIRTRLNCSPCVLRLGGTLAFNRATPRKPFNPAPSCRGKWTRRSRKSSSAKVTASSVSTAE